MALKERIQEYLVSKELNLGCYDKTLEKLPESELQKVLENAPYQADTDVLINKKPHVVEIDIVDDEVDFSVLTKSEYISRYGSERYDNL